MRSARKQAENYARALDEWPPFLIVVDVGHVIELYGTSRDQERITLNFPIAIPSASAWTICGRPTRDRG